MRKFKLYEIVLVQHPDYVHFGEVLSRTTPNNTYMVRMVPGHPNTLAEIAADKMLHTNGGLKYVHYAAVVGAGSFPVDMLRYDHCAPLNFDLETGKIDPDYGFDERVVARATARKDPQWTTARWSSFLWGIRPLHTEKLGEH